MRRQCDVCLNKHASGLRQGEFEDIEQDVLTLLAEAPRTAQEVVHALSSDEGKILQALSFLMSEEKIVQKEGKLYPCG